MVPQLFADDLVPGFHFAGEARTLSAEMFAAFAALTGDKHPIHYDAAYAARSRFGRPIAHGLLLAALTALGATALSDQLEDAMIAMLEERMAFLRPVFVGDIVTPRFEVVSIEPKGSSARVEIAVSLCDQAGQQVIAGHHRYLLRCRPRAA
jgi:acyl dehydratase